MSKKDRNNYLYIWLINCVTWCVIFSYIFFFPEEVLENLCQQEAVRQPLHIVDAQNEDVQSVLSSLYDTPNEDFMEND